ncbi:MAG: YicC family protein [Phycisphaeraceae bacterium]|nr:MAG: YicC family protein [Phycisphaeraceae bacterium]
MIRSMTGYGEASTHADGAHYFLDVRSLNNKYFKAVIRLPDEFQGLEAELESRLRERVSRGSVTLTARCSDESASAAYEVNHKALAKYVEQIRAVPQFAASSVPIDIGALLALPGVLQPPSHGEERLHAAKAVFRGLLDTALDALIAMREHEGRALTADFRQLSAFIAERLVQIAARAPEVVVEYERRLKARIEQMLRESDVKVEAVDLIREIAAYAERIDIAEETKRLGGHLDQFGGFLDSRDDKPMGRTIDFLAQEMLREANTIASKSPDAAISRWTVEIKGAIDRIKEQAANVE